MSCLNNKIVITQTDIYIYTYIYIHIYIYGLKSIHLHEREQTCKQFCFRSLVIDLFYFDCEFNIRIAAASREMLRRESTAAAVQGTVGQYRPLPRPRKIAVHAVHASARRRLPPTHPTQVV